MKKILLSFFAFLVVSVAAFGQMVPKMVMVEEFTQASCPPCEVLNPLVSPFLRSNADKLVLLKYHTSWPGVDPMNAQTETDVRPRVDYYGVGGVPNLFVEGTEIPLVTDWTQVANDMQASVLAAATDSTPIAMALSHTLSTDLQTANIRLEITNGSADMLNTAGMVLQVGLVEEEINFPEPPGSTSEQDFLYVMRRMLPSPSGTAIDNIPAGETVVIEMNDVSVPRFIYDYNKVSVVAFLQNVSTTAIAQAAVSTPQVLSGYADVAAAANTQAPMGLCDYDLTPSIRVENDNAEEITSLEVAYSLNGGAPVVESWTGTLRQGQWNIVNFPTVQIMPPSTTLEYAIVSVNGLPDVQNHNNGFEAEGFFSLSETPSRENFIEGVDISAFNEVPANTIFGNNPGERVIVSVLASSFGTAAPDPVVGGFGNSDGAFLFDFYNSASGISGDLIFDKVDLSNSTNTGLRFNHAYAQFSGAERDRIEVLASTDCGNTWTTVWDASGANLMTAPPVGNGFFIPNSTQWQANAVDLSAYDGQPDFTLAFRATSDFGNFGFLDDIELSDGISSTYDLSVLDGSVEIFPNPVSSDLVINLQLDAATPVTAEVYDLSGKKVTTLESNNMFPVGKHTLNWNVTDQPNGMYLVRVLTDQGEISRKISVLK